jgi:hypothetical protein
MALPLLFRRGVDLRAFTALADQIRADPGEAQSAPGALIVGVPTTGRLFNCDLIYDSWSLRIRSGGSGGAVQAEDRSGRAIVHLDGKFVKSDDRQDER